MSKALVKWRGPAVDAGTKMDTALARLHRNGDVETRRGQSALSPAPTPKGGEVVDLPRVCAVHDRPYAARYVAGTDGRFRHAQTIKVTEALYLGQYADGINQTRLVNSGDLGDETCPWCGASGFGSVRCGTCNREICYGKTVGRHFRCRDSCGGQGTMVSEYRTHEGVRPNSPRRGGYAAPGRK
jgi:hypothetical protein